MNVRIINYLFVAMLCCACSDITEETALTSESKIEELPMKDISEENPFLSESRLPLNYPRFDLIQDEHYLPAFERGMKEQLEEIAAITSQAAPPTFENTIVAMELSGRLYNRVASVFFAQASAHTNDEIQKLQQDLSVQLASHEDSIMLDRALYERILRLYRERHMLSLNDESKRLLEQTYINFVRAGAALNVEQQEQMKMLNAEIAVLETNFSQNVLNEANELAIVVASREELIGLNESRINAAASEAVERQSEGEFVIPLLNTSGQPSLAGIQNRALRERIHKTSLSRGHRGGQFDNRETLSKVLRKRAERAQLLGYKNHAEYIVEDQTAPGVDSINERLSLLAASAAVNTIKEAAELQAIIDEDGEGFDLASWDWDFYTEKLRSRRFEFDASELKSYFELDNVLKNGVFFAAEKLFGLTFRERFDFPLYQEDVRVFEVYDSTGEILALFIADFYARSTKRGGAWMNSYISQSNLLNTQPVIANHLNITKPVDGQPTLLTFGEVTTMFHEFGHALHGMFSDVEYPSFSGTRVPRDFVEYPSQVNEMWSTWPEVLKNYALHYQTGEPLPPELIDKVLSMQQFNQGFSTLEYLAASIVDQGFHQLDPAEVPGPDEIMDFESDTLEEAGILMPNVPPRYRVTYFNHIMGGYSAGYYSYIWSEVLDADTVEWFRENGGLSRANGDHFRTTLLSRGGSADAMSLYSQFRGRGAEIGPLLDRRGLN
ncbi:MAG: M3 family metallopeptidase [Gammaproteobacteria bacterium]|nr:M3 family metallopeptidase [Gammaproteobacteria bacterium]